MFCTAKKKASKKLRHFLLPKNNITTQPKLNKNVSKATKEKVKDLLPISYFFLFNCQSYTCRTLKKSNKIRSLSRINPRNSKDKLTVKVNTRSSPGVLPN